MKFRTKLVEIEARRCNKGEDMDNPKTFGPATDWAEDCMRWHGRILTGKEAHWCWDWDGLPIDETCGEYQCCTCA